MRRGEERRDEKKRGEMRRDEKREVEQTVEDEKDIILEKMTGQNRTA